MRILLLGVMLLVGCSGLVQSPPRKIRCGPCGMVIYDGPINEYRSGDMRPAGYINHCCHGECMCINPPDIWWECTKCNYKTRENTWDGKCPSGHSMEQQSTFKSVNPS